MVSDFGKRFAWICSFVLGVEMMNDFGIGGCDETFD